jgi:hypothetical protein
MLRADTGSMLRAACRAEFLLKSTIAGCSPNLMFQKVNGRAIGGRCEAGPMEGRLQTCNIFGIAIFGYCSQRRDIIDSSRSTKNQLSFAAASIANIQTFVRGRLYMDAIR